MSIVIYTNNKLSLFWGEDFTLSVELLDDRDSSAITDSLVEFSVSGTGDYEDNGGMDHQSSNPGTYTADFSTLDFNQAGVYTFVITAEKTQYEDIQIQEKSFFRM